MAPGFLTRNSGSELLATPKRSDRTKEPKSGYVACGEVVPECSCRASHHPRLRDLIDDMLLENDCLSGAIAGLDVERLRTACHGIGTDDSALIQVLATRNKRHLARVSKGCFAQVHNRGCLVMNLADRAGAGRGGQERAGAGRLAEARSCRAPHLTLGGRWQRGDLASPVQLACLL